MLVLTADELRLKHERSARKKAIGVAKSLMKHQGGLQSEEAAPNRPEGGALNSHLSSWCSRAARQFGLTGPVALAGKWGSMADSTYRQAWTTNNCDGFVFPKPKQNHASEQPAVVAVTEPETRHQPPQSLRASLPSSSMRAAVSQPFDYLSHGPGPRPVIKVKCSRHVTCIEIWRGGDHVRFSR